MLKNLLTQKYQSKYRVYVICTSVKVQFNILSQSLENWISSLLLWVTDTSLIYLVLLHIELIIGPICWNSKGILISDHDFD